MGFLSPLFLVGLAAVGVPLVLHLFRREVAPPVAFTAVRFLQKRTVERQERRRLQDVLLLLLRMAALALLALAFARPYLMADGPAQPLVVLAVDVSYSMGAPGRLDAARQFAAGVLDGLAPNVPVSLVSFGDRATVLADPTTDHGAVRALLASLTPGYSGTRYAAPVEAARGLLEGQPGRLVIVSDLQARGWARGTTSLPDNVRLEVQPVGARVDNVLIRDLVVTPREARVVVSNAGQRPAGVAVSLRRGDAAGASQALELDAGVSRDLTFAGPHAAGAYVARITDPGGLPADDERHAVLRHTPATTVRLLVGEDVERSRGFFLERAYAALGTTGEAPYAVSVTSGAAALAPEVVGTADLAVWLSATGIDRRQVGGLERFVRDGGRLVVACGPGLDPRVADVVTRPLGIALSGADSRRGAPGGLVADDPRHPLLAALGEARVDLARTTVTGSCDMTPAAGALTIARFSDGRPAIAEVSAGRGRLLVLGTDVARQWNDLPVQPGFVPLVGEMTRHLLGDAAGTRVALASVQDASYQRPGVWPVGPRGQDAAVNVDVSESDQTPMTREEFVQVVSRPSADLARLARTEAVRLENNQGLWRYGIALLGLALVVESLLARRPRRIPEVVS